MSSSMNDLTPEEQDPQNQTVIAFLKRAYVAHESPKSPIASAMSLDDSHLAAQVTARVRERLLSASEGQPYKPNLQLLRSEVTLINGAGYTTNEASSIGKKELQHKGFAFVALIAVLALVLASSFFLFQQIQLSKMARSNQSSTSPTVSSSEHARMLIKQFHEEVQRWGKTHPYQSPLDGKKYMLNSAYLAQGIGGELDQQLTEAKSAAAFKTLTETANKALFHLRMFEAAAADKTPYDTVHQSDIQLLKHYKLEQGTIVLVSTAEQALRAYRDSKLIKSILITTGRQDAPSLIGNWQVEDRQTDINFMSTVPQGTVSWSADTTVNYALSYHTGGYFIYSSWWRAKYGPGTQFPHKDTGGNTDGGSGSNDGSLGGIEMSTASAQWLYEQASIGTPVIIY